jgi:DNA-binding MarR family transcriptional regulator
VRAEDGALTLPQYHLLDPLEREEALPVGVLAEEAGVAAPTAT